MLDAAKVEIRPLEPADTFVGFSCDKPDLNEFLTDDAHRLHGQGVVSVYLATSGADLVGYVALLADCVRLTATERKKHGLLSDDHPSFPALKVGRLATHSSFQGRGIGTALLGFAADKALVMSELVGCRLLTLDAYAEKVDWYEKRGFVRNNRASRDLGWDCPEACPHFARSNEERISMRFDFTSETIKGLAI